MANLQLLCQWLVRYLERRLVGLLWSLVWQQTSSQYPDTKEREGCGLCGWTAFRILLIFASNNGCLEFAKKFYARNVTVDLSPVSLNCIMNYQHPYGLIAIHMTCPVKRFTTLARPIPLRLDDMIFASIPWPCATDSISQYHQVRKNLSFAATVSTGTQPAFSKPSFFISYRPNQLKKIFLPRSRLWNFCPLHKSIGLPKASTSERP